MQANLNKIKYYVNTDAIPDSKKFSFNWDNLEVIDFKINSLDCINKVVNVANLRSLNVSFFNNTLAIMFFQNLSKLTKLDSFSAKLYADVDLSQLLALTNLVTLEIIRHDFIFDMNLLPKNLTSLGLRAKGIIIPNEKNYRLTKIDYFDNTMHNVESTKRAYDFLTKFPSLKICKVQQVVDNYLEPVIQYIVNILYNCPKLVTVYILPGVSRNLDLSKYIDKEKLKYLVL